MTARELTERLRIFRASPRNSMGGHLHIFIEDGNMRDSHLKFCQAAAVKAGDTWAADLAAELLKMSKTQRTKIYNSL